jgi:hypothetical protein
MARKDVAVDEIISYKTEKDLYHLLCELIKGKQIDVRILGEDWQFKKFTGWDLDIPIFFNSRQHNYSTKNIRERILKQIRDGTKETNNRTAKG